MHTLTQVRLKELVHYEPETGSMIWLEMRAGWARPGYEVGGLHLGYRRAMIDGHLYLVHRLAWLYVTGEWPSTGIDHIDRCRSNNKFDNLRLATKKQNGENRNQHKNNKSGFRGVWWEPKCEKYRATIFHAGKRTFLGSHDMITDAVAARLGAERQLFSHAPQ